MLQNTTLIHAPGRRYRRTARPGKASNPSGNVHRDVFIEREMNTEAPSHAEHAANIANMGLRWITGDQTTQDFGNCEHDAGFMWLTRAPALKNEGQPIAKSSDTALLVGDRLAVAKGARHQAEALELLKFYLGSPDITGKFVRPRPARPSSDALQYMSAVLGGEQIRIRAEDRLLEHLGSRTRRPPTEWTRRIE